MYHSFGLSHHLDQTERVLTWDREGRDVQGYVLNFVVGLSKAGIKFGFHFLILISFLLMYVCLPHVYARPHRPKKGIDSPRTTGDCELPSVGVGN